MKLNKYIVGAMAAFSLIFASCSDILENSERVDGKTRVKIILTDTDETAAERTILPAFSKTDLTDITLYGKASTTSGTLSASDTYKITSWDTFGEMAQDDGVVLDDYGMNISGTWQFMLTASSNGSSMSATSESITINSSATTKVAFTLTVNSGETAGLVKVDLLELEDFDVAKVKYYWSFSQVSASLYASSATELTVTSDASYSKSATFEKSGVTAGNYYLTLYFYDSDGSLLVSPWQTSVIVEAGAKSYKELSVSEILGTYVQLYTYKVTYDANGGSGEAYEQTYASQSTVATLAASGLTSPEGKEFRGWNTREDGKGSRYSPGDNPTFTKDTTLYAQWASYDRENSVYTIESADDFWPLFSYTSNASSAIKNSSIKLVNDVTDLTDWIPVTAFGGTFDGNSKSLTYTVSSSASVTSLFESLSGTVKNLTLTGLTLNSGKTYVAGLASEANGATITGCTLTESSLASSASNAYVGGLIAKATSVTTSGNLIKGTSSKILTISGTNASYVGGLAGYAETSTFGTSSSPDKIQFAQITGSTTSTYGKGVGGFAGYTKNTNIVSTTVAYTSVTGYYAGGVTGYADSTTPGSSSYKISSPTITTNASYSVKGYYAGGIAGYNASYISSPVVSTATVTSSVSSSYIGGIAGYNTGVLYGDASTANVATGTITGSSYASYVGGAAGYNAGSVQQIVVDANTTITSAKASSYAAGLVGYNDTNGKIVGGAFKGKVTSTAYNYTAGVAAYNKGTIGTGKITVSGSVVNAQSAASVAGGVAENEGTVDYITLDEVTVTGTKASYAGGIVAYNEGTVSANNVVKSVTLTGYSSGKYGYVIGKNDGGTVSEDISNAYSTTTTKSNVSVDGKSTYYTVSLSRTSKLTLTVTDASGQGKLDFAISKTSGFSTDSSIKYYENLDAATATISAGYLEAGTYYINMYENYALGTCTATTIAWTVD